MIMAGCSDKKNATDSATPADITVGRLDIAAINRDSVMFDSLREGAEIWLSMIGANPDNRNEYFDRVAGKPYNDALADGAFATDSLEEVLGRIFGRAEALGLSLTPKRVYAVASPYNQTVVTADSLTFIALNHYLGPEKEFYAYYPDYIRRLKSPERIGTDVAEASITARYPFTPDTDFPTVIQRLAYEGAVIEAVMQITGADEREATGFTPDDFRWLEDNESQAWRSMLARDMVFSTDPELVEGMVRPNAVTSQLHHESPGRAGRFIGHRIVRKYLENHPATTLQQLLSPDFYNSPSLLSNAGYDVK